MADQMRRAHLARRRRVVRVAGVGAACAVAFAAGVLAGGASRSAVAGGGDRYRALDLFAQVFAHVENLYVEDVPRQELAYGAVEGLVGKLDPHSAFLRPDLYRAMRDETAGEFEGVGLELGLQGTRLTVIAPLEGSPGARAGIEPGDRLVAIDGVATSGMPLVDAVRRLKGAAGTPVRLGLEREGAAERDLVVLRERVVSESVDWRVADAPSGLVVIRIRTFQERTDRGVERALAAARKQLGREIGGLVLDLRSNPGGLLDEAVRVADRFLADGLIVTTEGRAHRVTDIERAHGPGTEPEYPLAVVVDGGSASASEILAGALQDHGRAAIVGSRTFGKGTVQQVIDLGDGSGLKLTVARYFTPSHRSIQDRGITPDVEVADADSVTAAPATPTPDVIDAAATPSANRDAALDAALAHVRVRARSRLH
ncbi:MAG TPA: S41 family peptidase [Anaeromyxobacteraceae bacterium]|nr:S41 family peptidase [Anaeromyxobacteraceae bacterium]